jgi:6-phosphogluconolactonase
MMAIRTMRAEVDFKRVFVGTFTYAQGSAIPADFGEHETPSRGLYGFSLSPDSGEMGTGKLVAETQSPAHLIVHSNRRVLYACHGQNTLVDQQNPITAYAIEGEKLRLLNSVPSGGTGPSHGVVDRTGRNLLTVNWSSSSLVCIRLKPDGSLGERTALIGNPPGTRVPPPLRPGEERSALGSGASAAVASSVAQTKPHCVVLSKSQRYAVVAEVEANRCSIYRFDAEKGSLQLHAAAPAAAGSGPRHLAFDPSSRYLYTADEAASTITAWRWDEQKGELTAMQQLHTAPVDKMKNNHPAHVAVHPNGRFVYVSNRGSGTLAGFRIDQKSGLLTALPDTLLPSKSCWCFDIDSSGAWLLAAIQTSDSVIAYRIHLSTGALTPTGHALIVPLPMCLRIV